MKFKLNCHNNNQNEMSSFSKQFALLSFEFLGGAEISFLFLASKNYGLL